MPRGGSDLRESGHWVLHRIGHEAQEPGRGAAVAHPVVEGQRELGDVAGDDMVDDPRTAQDPARAEDGDLGLVDDRRAAVHPEHPVVVEGERTAGELGGGGRAVAGGEVSLRISASRARMPMRWASRTTGTTRPRSVCAAMPRFTPSRWASTASSIQRLSDRIRHQNLILLLTITARQALLSGWVRVACAPNHRPGRDEPAPRGDQHLWAK